MASKKSAVPNTPVARRQLIVDILNREGVKSQSHLERLLNDQGLEVTQGTLSRDLDELGAVKVRDAEGSLVYAVPASTDGLVYLNPEGVSETRLARLCEELLISVKSSGNLAVVRTPPGAAQFFASTLDQSAIENVIGTIAGDDTIMIIAGTPDGGDALVDYLTALAERSPKTGS